MDRTSPGPSGEDIAPDALGGAARLPAYVVAREHPQKWASTGLPNSLAKLDVPLETVWAAVQLALSGANEDTVASTLGLTEHNARHIIVATTEQLLAEPPDATVSDRSVDASSVERTEQAADDRG